MAEIDDLTAQLVALKKARASGALVVRHGDTSITYRSLAEIRDAIAAVQGEINKLNGVGRGPNYVEQTGKGYR